MKRFVSGLLSLAIVITLFMGIVPIPANAASLSATEIQQKINNYISIVTENGTRTAYWNKGQNEATLKKYADQGKYAESVSYSKCPVDNGSHTVGTTCKSNVFNSSWQCHGFARYMCYVIFGSSPTYAAGNPKSAIVGTAADGWTTYARTSTKAAKWPGIQVGDLIRYNGHTAVVYSVSSNGTMEVVDCNHGAGRPCEIDICNLWNLWTVSIIQNAYNSGNAYICRYGGEPVIIDNGTTGSVSVTVSTTTADNITQTSAIVRGNVSVINGVATEEGMYFGNGQGSLKKLGTDYVKTSGVSFYYSTSKYGLTLLAGETYYYQAYAIVNGKEYTGKTKSFTTVSEDAGIRLNTNSTSLEVGKTVKLTATTTPSGQAVTWSSSNSSVAKVSNGTVTGVKDGTATITAKISYGGKSYSASCNVIVQGTAVEVRTKGADGITQTEAIVRGEVNVSGAKATECGMYFGDSSSNLTFLGSDSINASNMPFYYSANKYGRTLSAGTTYYYQAYAVVGGKTYWGDVKSFTTIKADTPTTTPTPEEPPVTVTTKGADGITQTEAIVRGEVNVSGAKATECGMYFGTSKNSLTKLGSDSINASSMPFYYSANKYGRTLTAGTTYYYQAYAVVGGKTYWGDVKSFTTEKSSVSVTVTTKGADSITKTSATVRGEVNVSGAKATECGMYFGRSSSNMTFLGSDSINANNMPFYYGTSKYGRTLSAGTTYYYQAYAVVGGKTYWGEVKSFTTTK